MAALTKMIFFSIFIVLLIDPLMSQDMDTEEIIEEEIVIKYPNIVKINTLALPFSNISLSYERAIKPRLSAGIGLGYKYGGTEPRLFSSNDSEISVNIDNIHGLSITPEARYYLKSCDYGKLEGFYAGLYLRYTGYSSAAYFDYLPLDRPPEYYNADISMKEYGVGIQLGYQMLLWERFSIDLILVGPRFSSYHFGYEFNEEPSDEFLNDLSGYLNEVVDRLGFDYNVNVKNEGGGNASTSFSFLNSRFGISLGFAF